MPRSADLAGRSVALSIDVPAAFDAPLAPHHKAIGKWVAAQEDSPRRFTRPKARAHIERVFDRAVLDILKPFKLADLRVVVLNGDDDLPPALAIICDTIGQLDLGWIEIDNVLSNTLFKRVAPVNWQAAAYKALVQTMGRVLPIFAWDDLFDEYAVGYWDGATDDASAVRCMVEYQGAELEDIDQEMLPSAMLARRPRWMIGTNASPLKHLPPGLREKIRAVRDAHKAVMKLKPEDSAWRFDFHLLCEYRPEIEDCSHLPPMTLVPVEHFGREIDDVAHHGMNQGFMDLAGLLQLTEASRIDGWFASLKLGADFLIAAQDLINLDIDTL